MKKQSLQVARTRAIDLIQRSDRILIGAHLRPDGDALGCVLALTAVLSSMGRRVAPLCADPVPDNYAFLPGAHLITSHPPSWSPQLGIAVDCDGSSRLGSLEPAFTSLPAVIDIDHHATDQAFGDVRLVDATAAASGEIVYELLRAGDFPISPDVATCLYAAVLTDTGRFSYSNTTVRSLTIAARLVESGADPHDIARQVYEGRSVAAVHLLGAALSRLFVDYDGAVITSILTRQDFSRVGAVPSETEGIIDHLRAVVGTRVAMLLVETEDHMVRVSLRSDGSVDVGRVALGFNGGGHLPAAGCTIAGTPEAAKAALLAALEPSLRPPDAPHGT